MLSVQARFAGLATDPAYANYYTGYTNGYVEFHITGSSHVHGPDQHTQSSLVNVHCVVLNIHFKIESG